MVRLLVLCPLLVSATALPAQVVRGPPSYEALMTCRTIADDAARLACFDGNAAALADAARSGDVVVTDREGARPSWRSLFGFGAARTAEEQGEDVSEIETRVASAGQMASGRWIIVMENGQRWRQLDTRRLVTDPRPGHAVRIRRAALGSFLANIDGQTAIRVQRER